VRTTYSADQVDAVAVYCEALDRCYLLASSLIDGMTAMHLRVAAAQNGQRASLHWARDYELSGAVAQLGRAPVWHTGGRGFESHQLHSDDAADAGSPETQIGAHEFRNLFGCYAERAAAGEEFLITRRGKPYVRLSAAHPQLAIASGRANPRP
jgi:PD-(D/E)XK endonuclease